MADRAIREHYGKHLLFQFLNSFSKQPIELDDRCLQVTPDTDFEQLTKDNPWLNQTKLVVKPDQLIKRRGVNKLLLLDADWSEVQGWIKERMEKELTIDDITGKIDTFLVEPFVPHNSEFEYYLAIRSMREGDEILFFRQGGVEVGNVEEKAERLLIPVDKSIDDFDLVEALMQDVGKERRLIIANFINAVFKLYVELRFSFIEINPFCISHEAKIVPLDLAARLDDTARFECEEFWGDLRFPAPFGRTAIPEERTIRQMDAKTGASLKFTLLNPKGRVWTLIAGGGASVVYTDTIGDLGYGSELANYGEYSGNPSDEETYNYTKTILNLMTKEKDPEGKEKVLLIGGGIANFTDVAKTFKGIISAIKESKEELKEVNTKIYVRRGGPNYKEGLRAMKDLGDEIGIPIEVYGPETHMTRIVNLALSN